MRQGRPIKFDQATVDRVWSSCTKVVCTIEWNTVRPKIAALKMRLCNRHVTELKLNEFAMATSPTPKNASSINGNARNKNCIRLACAPYTRYHIYPFIEICLGKASSSTFASGTSKRRRRILLRGEGHMYEVCRFVFFFALRG